MHTVLCKKISSTSRSVCEGLWTVREPLQTVCEGSFACYVTTNFKLCARMGCVIIYYVIRKQIANLLRKLPVREPVHEPFHAPRVSSWFICFHASQTYALHTYVHASVAKCMGHELTREAWSDSWTGSWPGSWTGESQSDFTIYALNCILQN